MNKFAIVSLSSAVALLCGCAQEPEIDYHRLSCFELQKMIHEKKEQEATHRSMAFLTGWQGNIANNGVKLDLMRLENAFYAKKCHDSEILAGK